MGKTWGKSSLLILLSAWIWTSPVQASDVPEEIEAEQAAVDSEAAIQAAEEARQRAEDEKIRLKESKRIAERERERARKTEIEAKAKLKKWDDEEKVVRTEREAADARIAAAKVEIQKWEAQVSAAQQSLEIAKAETDKLVIQRDGLEAESEKTIEHAKRLQNDVKTARERIENLKEQVIGAEEKVRLAKQKVYEAEEFKGKEFTDMKKQIATQRDELKRLNKQLGTLDKQLSMPRRLSKTGPGSALDRAVASKPEMAADSSGAGSSKNRSAGWVKLKKECKAYQDKVASSPTVGAPKVGDRLFANKVDAEWLKVKFNDGGTAYMNLGCFK